MASGPVYHGTNEEMRLGDRIAIQSMGSETVCSVTEIRATLARGTESAVDQCSFMTDDGIIHVVEYASGSSHPRVGNNIRLLCRSGCEVEAAAEFTGGSDEKKLPVSWWDIFNLADLGCGTFTAIGLIAVLAAWVSL